MADQADELRKLMKKQKSNISDESKETSEIVEIEKKIEKSDDKIEALVQRIINSHKHRNTQAESLEIYMIQNNFKTLSEEEKRNVLLHKELKKHIKMLDSENKHDALYIKTIIDKLTK